MASVDNLARLIMSELEAYSDEVEEIRQDETDKLTKELVKDLKSDPNIPERTGDYKKGFYYKRLAKGKGYNRNTIANKVYRLTHLLEDGHVTRNGGRVKAYPHWQHAQDKADTLPDRVKERLKK